jgi:4-amino-4-deoxy-L-arabinose transferase-like glycosyltransferase
MSSISPTISVCGERKAVERLSDARRSYSLYVFVGILLLVIAWGLFVRFNGLGTRPLVADEYFSIKPVQYILEKGVPEFPTGGYYLRGLPLQYLQAGSVLLFGDNEFAHRLPAVLFGVLTLALVFFYARIFLPWPLAVACVAILAVSGWQIEFSRFGRMYAAFQCVTVAFFLAYQHAYLRGAEKLRYLPHALALIAILCHELGVFLLPFLFLPLLIRPNANQGATPARSRWTFAIVSLGTILIGITYWQFDSRLRDFHVQQSLPDGFRMSPSDSLGPLGSYAVLPITGNLLGAFLVIMLVAGLFLFFRSRSKTALQSPFSVTDVGLLLLLLSTVLHLFAVSICIAAVLFIRYQLHGRLLQERGKLALLALSAVVACAWVVYAVYDETWREQMLTPKFLRALRIVFFGWPDFYEPIIRPLIASLPLLTVIFFAALAWHLIRQGRQSLTLILGHPIIIVLGVFCGIAVIDPILQPMLKTTRYVYHIYPFVILLTVMAGYEFVRTTTDRVIAQNTQIVLSGFVAIVLFVAGEDFRLQQLLHINSPEVTFRSGKFKRYEHLWFWRQDDRSPGEFLNAHRHDVDALVVSIHARTLPYYLDRNLEFAYYCSREGEDAWRYRDVARSKGKLELWTGRPLLGTEQELRDYAKSTRSLYLVRSVAPDQQDFNINHVWPDRLVNCERVFLSLDGNTEVVKISLN